MVSCPQCGLAAWLAKKISSRMEDVFYFGPFDLQHIENTRNETLSRTPPLHLSEGGNHFHPDFKIPAGFGSRAAVTKRRNFFKSAVKSPL